VKRLPVLPLVITVVVLVLDQLTKWWVTSHIPLDAFVYPIPALSPVLGLTLVKNTGVAFGLFQNGNALFAALNTVVIVVMAVYYRTLPPDRRIARFALNLLIAGALGNLLDRLRLGYVVDFVAVGSFARFNVADSAVSTGVTLLLVAWLLEHRRASSKVLIHEEH